MLLKSSHIALPMKATLKYLAKFHVVPATEDKSGPSIHTAGVLCLVYFHRFSDCQALAPFIKLAPNCPETEKMLVHTFEYCYSKLFPMYNGRNIRGTWTINLALVTMH